MGSDNRRDFEPSPDHDAAAAERETQLLADSGSSGMRFTVRETTNASSILLPAPSEQLSNPNAAGGPPEMSFADFLKGVGQQKTDGHESNHHDEEDFQISSSESSEEDP